MDDIDMSADAAPELRRGVHGPWVRYLNQLLEYVGQEPGPIDESFGGDTHRAVVAFQAAVGLPGSGIADRATWQQLVWKAANAEVRDSAAAANMGQKVAAHDKVDPGEQVGRRGWCNVNFQCTFLDHFHQPFPDSQVYLRFEDTASPDRDTSDEDGWIDDGGLVLSDIWIPRKAFVHIYVRSRQAAQFGTVDMVEGVTNLEDPGDHVAFSAVQHSGETQTMTYAEIEAWALAHGSTVQAGVSLYLSGTFGGQQMITHQTSWSTGENITVTLPGNGFDVNRTS